MESLKVRRNKSFFVIQVYFLFLFLNIFIADLSNYGYIQSIVFTIVFFFCNQWKSTIKNLLFTFLLLTPILLITKSNYLYYINDFLTLFLVLSCIDSFTYFDLSNKQGRIVALTLLLYTIIYLVCTAFPSFYDEAEGRYRGLMQGANISSSVIMLIIAFMLEYYRKDNIKFWVYGISLACFLVIMFLSNTRSVFLVVPYLLWLYKENINFKKAWPILLALGIIGLFFIIPNSATMSEELRLSNEDNSYLTRVYLYEQEFEGISKNHYIIPHGFNACITFVRNLLNNEGFSPHNDLFSYWYDWGGVWLIVLVALYIKIKRYVKKIDFKLGAVFLFVFVISCGLHNIMLNIFIWIPIILIMWRRRIQYESTKIQ